MHPRRYPADIADAEWALIDPSLNRFSHILLVESERLARLINELQVGDPSRFPCCSLLLAACVFGRASCPLDAVVNLFDLAGLLGVLGTTRQMTQ